MNLFAVIVGPGVSLLIKAWNADTAVWKVDTRYKCCQCMVCVLHAATKTTYEQIRQDVQKVGLPLHTAASQRRV